MCKHIYRRRCGSKSPIQNIVQNAAHNEQLDKILDFVLGTILMGMLIVYLIIWPPVLLDVPEYLSGTGEMVTGTITSLQTKSDRLKENGH